MIETKIQWTHATHNFWEGCTKVSPGCANCYAETANQRWHEGRNWGKGAPRLQRVKKTRLDPLNWNRKPMVCDRCEAMPSHPERVGGCNVCGSNSFSRMRVFCGSMMDWLDDEVPIEWFVEMMDVVFRCQNLNWLMLTKRPENWLIRVSEAIAFLKAKPQEFQSDLYHWLMEWSDYEEEFVPHIWFGFTAENQEMFDKRWKIVRNIPARYRFVSIEPQIGPVSFVGRGTENLHWAIYGGESGPNARHFKVEWAEQGVQNCFNAGIAPFVKQLGSDASYGGVKIDGSGKKGDWTFWPDGLRIKYREWPDGKRLDPETSIACPI